MRNWREKIRRDGKRCNDDILELNDRDLKRRAGKYREFFEQNNEKPTGVFFNLGKEKEGDDNTERIKNDIGDKFENSKQSGIYTSVLRKSV